MHNVQTAWTQAYERLSGTDPETLDCDALESLADAAFWLGRPHESISARQRAYAQCRDAGDDARAARAAWLLFHTHFDLDETSVANGWLARGLRHAEAIPGQVEPGYVALSEADWAHFESRFDDAANDTQRAIDTARQFADGDLEAMGLASQGRMLIAGQHVADGLQRLDDAMVATLSDSLSPYATGWVHCVLLSTCEQLGDVRRAAEWSERAVRWSEEHGHDSGFPGVCRLHRCGVHSLRGEWAAAEQGALRAADELSFAAYLVADGLYLAGEIRLRRGDYAAAEDAFRAAHDHGRSPHPGLALLRLAQGDADAAASALTSALAAGPAAPVQRARMLAAHVDAELSRGNRDPAQRSAEQLDDLADANRAPLLQAMAAAARAAVLLETDAPAAFQLLGEACRIYRELSCPYDVAQTRVLMGVAARRMQDEETARLEFGAARVTFERLGAGPDLERVLSLLDRDGALPAGLTGREVEVLRQVARGRSNKQIAAELFISEHTVARHLSNIFGKVGVTSRSAAASFAHEHKLA